VPFELRERVRWGDVDAAAVMYFGAYSRLLEAAETELYRELGFPWHEMFETFDIWLPRVHFDVTFRAPARLDDAVVVRTWLRAVGSSSVRMAMAIHRERDDRKLTDIGVVTVCVDRPTLSVRPLPEPVAQALRAHIETPP
jgi:acyl-CoA thioester hydrolase